MKEGTSSYEVRETQGEGLERNLSHDVTADRKGLEKKKRTDVYV